MKKYYIPIHIFILDSLVQTIYGYIGNIAAKEDMGFYTVSVDYNIDQSQYSGSLSIKCIKINFEDKTPDEFILRLLDSICKDVLLYDQPHWNKELDYV